METSFFIQPARPVRRGFIGFRHLAARCRRGVPPVTARPVPPAPPVEAPELPYTLTAKEEGVLRCFLELLMFHGGHVRAHVEPGRSFPQVLAAVGVVGCEARVVRVECDAVALRMARGLAEIGLALLLLQLQAEVTEGGLGGRFIRLERVRRLVCAALGESCPEDARLF